MSNPYARIIMALQIEFGLTFQEAIRIKSYLHVTQDGLWITRDIAFNSSDRCIPFRTENQKAALQYFDWLTKHHDNLLELKSYEELRLIWRTALAQHRLSRTKSWRYLYAKQMYAYLLAEHGNYKTCLMIRNEMGIKSRNTLCQYLKA